MKTPKATVWWLLRIIEFLKFSELFNLECFHVVNCDLRDRGNMKIAIISDIHSNKYALNSALEKIEEDNVDFIICTGDLVGYMNYPNEVIDTIRKNKIATIKGNHDKKVGESLKISDDEMNKYDVKEITEKASIKYTNFVISDENRIYINSLADKFTFECGDKKIIAVHGSIDKIDEYIFEDDEIFENIYNKLDCDILISGHTHKPYFKKFKDKWFINSGSVGKPKTGKQHGTYAVLEIAEEIKCDIKEFSYDIDSMICDIKDNEMISNELIDSLLLGK